MLIFILLVFIFIKFFLDIKYFKFKINLKYFIYSFFQIVTVILLLYICKHFLKINIFGILMVIYSGAVINYVIFYFHRMTEILAGKNHKKYLLLSLIILISVIIEIFICNFKFFQTITYQPRNISNGEITILKNTDYYVVEIDNLNTIIHNIYIDVDYPCKYDLTIEATDEGNELYTSLPSREISNKVEKSKYISLQLSGEAQKIKLNFSILASENPKINKISLNNKIPIIFNVIRCLIIDSILLFLVAFKSSSNLYNVKFLDYKYKKVLIGFMIIVYILTFSVIGNNVFDNIKNPGEDMYNHMGYNLLHGKVYLYNNHSSLKILDKMTNPYDKKLRDQLFENESEKYLWDRAYYKGKYYMYFGVIPVILFYIPYQIIFNHYLSTPLLVFFCTISIIILIMLLLYQLVKKYYQKCSVGIFLILSLLLTYCSGLMYFMKKPNIYALPIASALMFSLLGINLWVSCINSKRLYKTKLMLGSFSMALVAGCRPQLLVGSLLLIPILLEIYGSNSKNSKKVSLLQDIIVIIIPYLIVAILLMYYNYVRFDSPFDFGANYNLTTNDMTVRGFKLSRLPLGFMIYLFNPVNFKNVFPFICETELYTNYMGVTIYEPLWGGLLFTTLIYSVSLFLPKFKKVINNRSIYLACYIMLISALLIVCVDTQMAGILARYLTDFSWLFGAITAIIILSIENKKFKHKNYFYKVVFILVVFALVYQFFYCFVCVLDQYKNDNINLWMYFNYLIQFWL